MLGEAKWRMLIWRKGTNGPLGARFAVRVRIANGPPQRSAQGHGAHARRRGLARRRASREQKYYLANLPPGVGLKALAATIKARWICEQAHKQLKEELGLDHFEGRSRRGLLATP
jgi:SRSO17 transposase